MFRFRGLFIYFAATTRTFKFPVSFT